MPAVSDSNPKHTIWAIMVKLCTKFVIVLRKGQKNKKEVRFGKYLKR